MVSSRTEVFDQLAVVGKAFASAKRLELIDLLTQGERTVEGLSHEAGLGLSTTSAHLQVLKLSNLVRTRREGTKVHYRLAGEDIAALFDRLRGVAVEHSPDVERALDSYLGTADVQQLGETDLLHRLHRGEHRLIDVRPSEEYAAGRIPGAESIPFGELQQDAQRWEKGQQVVAYCRGAYCVLASDAVRLLRSQGVPAVRLEGGMLEWRLHGQPVEVDG